MCRHWKTELDRKKSGKKPRLLVAVLKCFWLRIIVHGMCLFSEVSPDILLIDTSIVRKPPPPTPGCSLSTLIDFTASCSVSAVGVLGELLYL